MNECSVARVTGSLRFLWMLAAALLAGAILAGPATGALAASGSLTYRGCISGETESGPVAAGGTGACRAIARAALRGMNSGLDNPLSLLLSGNGKSLYVSSNGDDAVARFARNTRSGALTYRGCISAEAAFTPWSQVVPSARSGNGVLARSSG